MKPGTILVVEDEEQVRTLLVRLLEKRGYPVEAAENGRHALDVASGKTQAISLVVTDMVMPELGGAAMLRELWKERPELRALCMTGYSRDEVAGAENLTNAAFIEKPFTPATFLDHVADLMK